MPFKTPKFWYQQELSLLARILSPLSYIYGQIAAQRMVKRPKYASKAKVICIGNLTAGGSGKTPTALALKDLISANNIVYLSRGYGGSLKEPTLITTEHTAKETGDEPQLLAKKAPAIVSKDRIKGAKLAEEHNADVIIMDDGLQNPSLFKDIRFCIIDGHKGLGNLKPMPSGPLRQEISTGLSHVDAFIVIGEPNKQLERLLPKSAYIFNATIRPNAATLPDNYKDNSYLAFCGIAHPDKFKASLEELNVALNSLKSFPDHYDYKESEMKALYSYASSKNLRLITTEKDAVKIPDGPWNAILDVLPIKLEFNQEKQLKELLSKRLSGEL